MNLSRKNSPYIENEFFILRIKTKMTHGYSNLFQAYKYNGGIVCQGTQDHPCQNGWRRKFQGTSSRFWARGPEHLWYTVRVAENLLEIWQFGKYAYKYTCTTACMEVYMNKTIVY